MTIAKELVRRTIGRLGRTSFSGAEADEIRNLLRQKQIADRDDQKRIRARLRRSFGFYISDFAEGAQGFTASDFDDLVARGAVQIVDEAAPSPATVTSLEPSIPETPVLSDVLAPNLRVVFCGTAVGSRSAAVRAYYAGPGNQFWPVLARTGLTPDQLEPRDFGQLLAFGIGLTDLAKFDSGADSELSVDAFDRDAFRSKIEAISPKALAFNGKRAAEAFFDRPVTYGRQRELLGTTAMFVLPSTSGAARGFWDESHWQELARFVGS